MLVYDITNSKSFDNLNVWRQEFLVKAMPKDPEAIPFFVLGNKVDLENERQVTKGQVEEWLQTNNDLLHYETSALDGTQVNEAFHRIAKNYLEM